MSFSSPSRADGDDARAAEPVIRATVVAPGGPTAEALTPASVLAIQRRAGNRAVLRSLAASRQLQREPDALAGYMHDDDWARAASALGELGDADIRARITAMSTRQRELITEGARFGEPAPWVEKVISALTDVDLRSALIGSLKWARFMHAWSRAYNWFHGLSLDDGPGVARRLGYGPEELAQVIGNSAYLQQMFPNSESAHVELDWPRMNGGAGASPTELETLRAVVKARNALTIRSELADKVAFGGNPKAGYQYLATGKGVSAIPATAEKLPSLAAKEFFTLEGGSSAVVTYDGTLSFGSGFADSLASGWMRTWFNSDHQVQRALESVGMSVSPGGTEWVVVDDSEPPNVLRGESARQFIRDSPRLLSLFATLAESPEHVGSAVLAQIKWINRKIQEIPEDLRKQMAAWPDDSVIASALHCMWWLPAGGPSGSPGRYRGTGGDAYRVAQAFALGLAGSKSSALHPAGPRTTSARIIGATGMTGGVMTHYFDQFGAGGNSRGVLRRGVQGSAVASNRSINDVLNDVSLDGHTLLVGAGQSGKPPDHDAVVPMYDVTPPGIAPSTPAGGGPTPAGGGPTPAGGGPTPAGGPPHPS